MHRLAFSACLLAGFLATCAAFAADPLVVDLWPGNTPGDVGINGEENSRTYQSPIIAGPVRAIDRRLPESAR